MVNSYFPPKWFQKCDFCTHCTQGKEKLGLTSKYVYMYQLEYNCTIEVWFWDAKFENTKYGKISNYDPEIEFLLQPGY